MLRNDTWPRVAPVGFPVYMTDDGTLYMMTLLRYDDLDTENKRGDTWMLTLEHDKSDKREKKKCACLQ